MAYEFPKPKVEKPKVTPNLPLPEKSLIENILDALNARGDQITRFLSGDSDSRSTTVIPTPRSGMLNNDQSNVISKRLDPYDQDFVGASKETNVPISWLKAYAMKESSGNPNAKSGQDWGMMQVRPGTWKYYSGEFRNDKDTNARLNPKGSIYTAARYIADMQKKYPKWTREQLVEAYNTGETAMRENKELQRTAKNSDYVKKWDKYYKTVDSLEKSRRFP